MTPEMYEKQWEYIITHSTNSEGVENGGDKKKKAKKSFVKN